MIIIIIYHHKLIGPATHWILNNGEFLCAACAMCTQIRGVCNQFPEWIWNTRRSWQSKTIKKNCIFALFSIECTLCCAVCGSFYFYRIHATPCSWFVFRAENCKLNESENSLPEKTKHAAVIKHQFIIQMRITIQHTKHNAFCWKQSPHRKRKIINGNFHGIRTQRQMRKTKSTKSDYFIYLYSLNCESADWDTSRWPAWHGSNTIELISIVKLNWYHCERWAFFGTDDPYQSTIWTMRDMS